VTGAPLPRFILNRRLDAARIPPPDADWDSIQRFALTFNGYKHWGSFERCAEIAEQRRSETLTDLRTCLFFQQRRWRHLGCEPYGEEMRYIRGVLEEIRRRVAEANRLLA
jgi:hypothetical protein